MKEQLEKRLAELKAEMEAGQQKLNQLNAETTQVQHTLLRISGAVQVLEEELGKERQAATDQSATVASSNGLVTDLQ